MPHCPCSVPRGDLFAENTATPLPPPPLQETLERGILNKCSDKSSKVTISNSTLSIGALQVVGVKLKVTGIAFEAAGILYSQD